MSSGSRLGGDQMFNWHLVWWLYKGSVGKSYDTLKLLPENVRNKQNQLHQMYVHSVKVKTHQRWQLRIKKYASIISMYNPTPTMARHTPALIDTLPRGTSCHCSISSLDAPKIKCLFLPCTLCLYRPAPVAALFLCSYGSSTPHHGCIKRTIFCAKRPTVSSL